MALAADGPPPVTERGDALALRRSTDELLAMFAAGDPETPKVARQDHQIEVADGSTILARWYTKAGSNPGSAIVYYHGGGLVAGTVDNYDGLVTQYVQATGVPFLSVEYRLAPEVTGSTLVEDGHTAGMAGRAGRRVRRRAGAHRRHGGQWWRLHRRRRGFDRMAPDAAVAEASWKDRYRAITTV